MMVRVFGHLRPLDEELFVQLGDIAGRLKRSATQLERLLAEPREAAADIAQELERVGVEQAAVEDASGNVRSFTGFTMRLDRMEYRELATALDRAAEAVQSAAVHVQRLHPGRAPAPMRALARTLTATADALDHAVPFVRTHPADIVRLTADVERLVEEGQASYYEGVGVLFEGTADAVDVLRWKDMYETMRRALMSCARGAIALDRLSRA